MAITQFQNGFITKNKLNELVDQINTNMVNISGNSDDIEVNTTKLALIEILTADTTKTVGSGGDFTTLNLALSWCKKVIPNGYNITLNILSGTTIQEYVYLENQDLSFVTISSVDTTVTIDGDYLTDNDGTFVSFIHGINSKMPIVNFNMTLINESSTYNSIAIYLEENSIMKFGDNITISNFVYEGVRLNYNSSIHFNVVTITGVLYGITAMHGSRVSCTSSTISGTTRGIQSLWGSTVDASDCACSGTTGFYVGSGGIINASSGTGVLSQTANTITSSGIIFQ